MNDGTTPKLQILQQPIDWCDSHWFQFNSNAHKLGVSSQFSYNIPNPISLQTEHYLFTLGNHKHMQNVAYKCSSSGSWTVQILVGIHRQLLLWAFLCRCGRSHDLYSCSSCLLQNRTSARASASSASLCADNSQIKSVQYTQRQQPATSGKTLYSIRTRTISLQTGKAQSPILQSQWPQGLSIYDLFCAHVLWLQDQKPVSLDLYSMCILIQRSHFIPVFIKPPHFFYENCKVADTWQDQSLKWSSYFSA